MERAEVYLTDEPRDGLRVFVDVLTDAQGRFAFERLAAGAYRCSVDGRSSTEQPATAGGPPVELSRGW